MFLSFIFSAPGLCRWVDPGVTYLRGENCEGKFSKKIQSANSFRWDFSVPSERIKSVAKPFR